MLSNVGGAVLLFGLSVLIGRGLGREALGVYSAVLAWLFPLSLLVDFGISTLVTREVAQRPQNSLQQLASTYPARLMLGILCAAILFIAAPVISDRPDVVTGLRLSAPLVLIGPLYSTYSAVFRALGAMWPIPWLNMGMLAAQVGLSVVVLALGGDVIALLVVNLLTSAGQLIAAWGLWRWRFAPLIFRPSESAKQKTQEGTARRAATRRHGLIAVISQPSDYANIAALLRRGWPFALAGLLAALQMRTSIILLERSASVDEVAYFAAASRFTEAARLLPNAFFGALFPMLAALRATPEALQRTFARAIRRLLSFGVASVVGAVLLAEPVIRLTYGPGFEGAARLLPVLSVALLFSLLRGAYTLALYARDHEGRVNRVNGVMLIVQVCLSLVLIPSQAAYGAALALAVCEAVGCLWLWHEQRRG
jgi:O-antigen/teichoic acid export membrane protein